MGRPAPHHALLAALCVSTTAACIRPRPVSQVAPVAAAAAPIPGPGAARRYDLRCGSGLRLLYEQRPSSHVATVTMMIDAGSREDPPGREGLAHLVEHLTFRAAQAREAALGLDVIAIGVRRHADTGPDVVTYEAAGPRRSLDTLIAGELARLANPLAAIDDAILEVERNVVRNELRQNFETNFSRTAADWLWAEVFAAPHPYSRPVIGSHESLASITLPELRDWASSHYRPDRTTMVVTGPLPVGEAAPFIRRMLSPALCGVAALEARALRRPPAGDLPVEAAGGHPIVRRKGDVPKPELWIGWSVPGGQDRSRFALGYWRAYIVEHLAAPALQDPDVTEVSCGIDVVSLASMAHCRLRLVEGKDPEGSARRLHEALARAVEGDLARDVPGKKRYAEVATRFSRERSATWGRWQAAIVHETGEVDDELSLGGVRAVGSEDVASLVRRYLTPERAHAVLVEPRKLGDASAGTVPDASRTLPSPPRTFAPNSVLHEIAQTAFLADLQTTILPNGLLVAAVPREEASVVTVSLGFRGGTSYEDGAVARVAFDAVKLPFETPPEEQGLRVQPWFGADNSGIDAFAGAEDLERAIDMVGRAVREYQVVWPAKKFLDERLPALRRSEAEPSYRGWRLFYSRVLSGRYVPGSETPDDLAALPKQRIVDWLHRTFSANNGILIVSGAVEPARVFAAARRALGALPSGGQVRLPSGVLFGPVRGGASSWPEAPGIVERPGASQVEVHLGCPLPPGDSALDAMYDVVAEGVEGDLNVALRQMTGATYEVDVKGLVLAGGAAYLRMGAKVGNGQWPHVRSALAKYWQGFKDGSRHFNTLRNPQIWRVTDRLFRFESSDALAKRLSVVWAMGWPLGSVDRYGSYVEAVRPDDATRLLRGCASNLVVSLTGEPAVIAVSPPR